MEVNTQISQQGFPPKNWLIESILVTLFCCQILGIIGIIYSARVESKFYKGDITGAESDANTAKTMVLISVAIGVIGIAFAIVVLLLGGFASIFGGLKHAH